MEDIRYDWIIDEMISEIKDTLDLLSLKREEFKNKYKETFDTEIKYNDDIYPIKSGVAIATLSSMQRKLNMIDEIRKGVTNWLQ